MVKDRLHVYGYKDFLKSLISPAKLDRFLPNFADHRIEATDMFPMSFNLSVISPVRLDRFLPNFAGRRIEATDMFPMNFKL